MGHLGGEIGELGEKIGGEGLRKRREGGADGMVERKFEAGQDVGVEPCFVELRPGEGDEVAPLVAQTEHFGEERLALGEVAVAVQQEVAQGSVEVGVACAEQQ